MAALSLMLPAGFALVSAAGLGPTRAWDAAMGALAASGTSVFVYWAIGYGLQFGGIGLVYSHAELQPLVWEWSALSSEWGSGWGMAGLSGWFLSGSQVTPLMYALFLAHLPWVMTASMIPVIALRGRAPATATILIAIIIGGVVYPLAGNWVQGGGWLSALGRNLSLGHGLVDYAGTGTVFLVASSFAIPALLVWVPKRRPAESVLVDLPAAHLPLLCIVGGLMVLVGAVGWLGSNPLQVTTLSELALLRANVAIILCAGGGVLAPVIYTWFVTGQSDPLMSGRGFAAGAIAGLATAPFIQPGSAFVLGALVGALLPFVTYISNHVLKLDDTTGIIHMCVIPASLGLLFTGFFADGIAGAGWQLTGVDSFLGVTGQGVTGLLAASGYQPDFPAQLQAQVIGVIALGLWGFISGLLVCTPLALLYRAVDLIPGVTTSAEIDYSSEEDGQPQSHAQNNLAYFDDQQNNDFQEEDLRNAPTYSEAIPQTAPVLPEMSTSPEPQPRFTALTRRRASNDPK